MVYEHKALLFTATSRPSHWAAPPKTPSPNRFRDDAGFILPLQHPKHRREAMSHPNFFSSVQPDPQLASIFPSNQLPRLLHTPLLVLSLLVIGNSLVFGDVT